MGFLKGHIINRGRQHTDEWKKRISEHHKKRGILPPSFLGKHHTNETREKISKAQKELVEKRIHRFWKGGLTKQNYNERKNLMSTLEYKIWRTTIFDRDHYTCQECGIKNGCGCTITLEAHHIKPYSTSPELRLDINNGITLCSKCHRKYKKWKFSDNETGLLSRVHGIESEIIRETFDLE